MKNFFIKKIFNLASKHPKTIAINQDGNLCNYNEFYRMVVNLSKKILKKKIAPVILIVGDKSILGYVSMFSSLYSGGTYIPVTANNPINKIVNIIKSTKVDIIICKKKNSKKLKEKFPNKIFFDEKDLSNKKYLCLPNIKKQNKLAYIIFTSGSTGAPKGVCISRSSLEHYIKWLNKNFKIEIGEICSQFPDIGFDLSVADIFGTLCAGGTLYPSNNQYYKIFPGRLIREKKISTLICVPSLVDVIINSGDLNKETFSSVKKIFFCGEPLLKAQVNNLFKVNKKIKIINAYGPTETTVSCTKKTITLNNLKKINSNTMPLGKAINGMKIKLLNNDKFSKQSGEIIIYGKQVGEGYLNKNENINKFFFPKNRISFFRSGDYAEIINGEMYFKNRLDTQVKIKGYRIELDEINKHLDNFGVKNARSLVYKNKILTFYPDCTQNIMFNHDLLIRYLKRNIPDYMIPNHIFKLKRFPLNQNGKISDKKLLKKADKILNGK